MVVATGQRTFQDRLVDLGYVDYGHYLRSKYWRGLRGRYRLTNLPKFCVGCLERKYQLHHWTYERLGNERCSDVIPLCEGCHHDVHAYSKAKGVSIRHTHEILRDLKGWTQLEMCNRFAAYYALDRDIWTTNSPAREAEPPFKNVVVPSPVSGRVSKGGARNEAIRFIVGLVDKSEDARRLSTLTKLAVAKLMAELEKRIR